MFSSGGNLYWSQRSEKSMSLSVEISSYVLLATLSATPTTADLGYASRIVRWLTSQQNSYGGFSSTQVQDLLYRGIQLYRGITDLLYSGHALIYTFKSKELFLSYR